ncbi:hypothetical protein GDO86_017207 [Hymenochirus boettgeri]|uniref:FAM234A/B beta-propeller domain-containing protein n=1 Tax=Hymenochirus boettgeri TaxID=247094 RepID=A0A8T2IJC9_9PIPI|nr:hypothetical protein GDO86_017207 [Hymenochirus boettgeri]
MDNKDLETEIHPLKNSEGKPLENNDIADKEAVITKSGISRLSRFRTAAFFAALFLCLVVVFAFSFIIPCPVRPHSQRTWVVQYENTVTYAFLTTEDVNEDKVKDVIILIKTDSISNVSCMDEGFKSPCLFLIALSGTNGSALWTLPVSDNVQLAECGIENLGGVNSGCLIVGTPYFSLAIDSKTGEKLWKESSDVQANIIIKGPVIKIPDIDGDNIQDLMLISKTGEKKEIRTLSGLKGDRIGRNRDIISGYSVRNLYPSSLDGKSQSIPFKQDPDWKGQTNISAGYVPILPVSSSGDILHLLTIPGKHYKNLLVVKSEVSELLDGQRFNSLWSLNTSNIVSKPALGYFKKDTLSIIIEQDIGNGRKKVLIVESDSGSIQWQVEINNGISNPNPATLNTGDHRSVFLFWGESTFDMNNTVGENISLFMFHPTLPRVLLELSNHTENIVFFDAFLFESSRHACYVLLKGPETAENPGIFSVSKQKLKEDITNSRVIRIGKEEASDQMIRDYFFKLRYSSQPK